MPKTKKPHNRSINSNLKGNKRLKKNKSGLKPLKFSKFNKIYILMITVVGIAAGFFIYQSRAAAFRSIVSTGHSENCTSEIGVVRKETNSNSQKRNFNVCRVSAPKKFVINTYNYGKLTGSFTQVINEIKSRGFNAAKTCVYIKSVGGTATVNLGALGEQDTTKALNINTADYQEYCDTESITATNKSASIEVVSGVVDISSMIIDGLTLPGGPAGSSFFEDFSNPASYDRFSKISWHRDPYLGGGSFEADHAKVEGGSDPDNCTNPFTTRTIGRTSNSILVESGEKHVYRCAPGDDPGKAHIMTAQGAESGYDFSAFWTKDVFDGVTEVNWEQNITNLGGRNWSEVKIVPVRTWNPLQPPCGITWVPCWTLAEGGSEGNTRTHAEMDSIGFNWFNGTPLFVSYEDEGGDGWNFRPDVKGSIYQLAEYQFQAFSSPTPRFRHTLRDNGNGTITALIDTKLTEYGVFEIATIKGSFPDEPFVVVFSTHDYTSGKSTGAFGGKTWHWDNIDIK